MGTQYNAVAPAGQPPIPLSPERLSFPEDFGEKVDQEVSDTWQTLGIKVKSQGDPRGYAIRVYLPSGMSNSFAGDGYGVPA